MIGRASHRAYEGLPAAWRELTESVRASGHTPAPDPSQTYVAGSESSRAPATWRTELNRPLTR